MTTAMWRSGSFLRSSDWRKSGGFIPCLVLVAVVLSGCGDSDTPVTAPVTFGAAEVAGQWRLSLVRKGKCPGIGVDPGTIPVMLRAFERGDSIHLAGTWSGPESEGLGGPRPLLGALERRTAAVVIGFYSSNQYGWQATGTVSSSLVMSGEVLDPVPGSDPVFTESRCAYSFSARKVS